MIWYYSFKTSGEKDYLIGAVNKTHDSNYLGVVLCDEGGKQIDYEYAGNLGSAGSIRINLAPDTIYYIKVYSNDSNSSYRLSDTPVDYSLFVAEATYVKNHGFWNSRKESDNPTPGSHQDDAAEIPLNTRITGTATDALIWYYSFKTSGEKDYLIGAVNKTHDSKYLGVVLCDEGGKQIDYKYVGNLGSAESIRTKLAPDTIYYIKVYSNDSNSGYKLSDTPVDYSLFVKIDE